MFTTIRPSLQTGTRTRTRNATRIIAALAGTALAISACGNDDDVTRESIIADLADGAGVSNDQAACIVDTALETRTLDELVAIGSADEIPADLQEEITQVTMDCIVGGGTTAAVDAEATSNTEANTTDTGETLDTADTDTNDTDTTDTGEAPGTTEAPDTTVAPLDDTAGDDTAGDDTTGDDTTGDDTAVEFVPATQLHVDTCAAGIELMTAWSGADLVPEDNPVWLEAVFSDMGARIVALAAVDGPFAAQSAAMQESFATIATRMAATGHDFDRFLAEEADALSADATLVETLVEDLETYLADVCGNDLGFIEELGGWWAYSITDGGIPAPDVDEQGLDEQGVDEPIDSPPPPFVEVTDDLGRISVEVPIAWVDVDGAPIGPSPSLVAAPDTTEFMSSWLIDGMHIVVQDTDGGADGAMMIATSTAAQECTLVSTEPYDDGVYIGEIATFRECGGTSTEAVVIGANDADESFEVGVALQFTAGIDQNVLDTVIQTFFVD